MQKVDIAVIETGLGGRLDSTNIITPIVSVITNIGIDHTRFLGKTIRAIAGEKAGIIKEGVPAVISESTPVTQDVFSEIADLKGSPLRFAHKSWKIRKKGSDIAGEQVLDIYRNRLPFLKDVVLPLAGRYQMRNLPGVLETAEVLSDAGFTINKEDIRRGLERVKANTHLRGRWEILGQSPLIIADVAHNEAGIRLVVEQLLKIPHNRLHIVLGMVNDKEVSRILRLLPTDAIYYFCRPDIPRGLDARLLRGAAESAGMRGRDYPSVDEAFRAALASAGISDLVYAGGSTFVVAEILVNSGC